MSRLAKPVTHPWQALTTRCSTGQFSVASAVTLCVAGLLMAAPSARAGEVYANLGLPGLGLGYAHAVSGSLTLRADVSSLGNHRKTTTESGIDYQATGKLNRVGLFADWFVLGGGFRLTGGITSNDLKLDLLAQGNGGSITIGNTAYTATPADQLNIKIRFPRTTPYLGIGWGHQLSQGWGFVMDIGASFGKATLSETHTGPNLSQVSQADLDAELAQLREGVGKIRALPQVSLGIAARF